MANTGKTVISTFTFAFVALAAGQAKTLNPTQVSPSQAYIGMMLGPSIWAKFRQEIGQGPLATEPQLALKNLSAINTHIKALSTCQRDYRTLTKAAENLEDWALRFFDSSAKLPSGSMDTAPKWMGDYGQCYRIKNHPAAKFIPKFCFLTWVFRSSETANSSADPDFSFYYTIFQESWGECVPESCDVEELAEIFEGEKLLRTVSPVLSHCVEETVQFTEYTYAAIACFSVVGFFLLCGLLTDMALRVRRLKRKADMKRQNKYEPAAIEMTSLEMGGPSLKSAKLPQQSHKSLPLIEAEEKKKAFGHFASLLLCFSPWTNFEKLLTIQTSVKKTPDLSCINGIRALSLFWVVIGHVVFYPAYINFAFDNYTEVTIISQSINFMFIMGGFLAVDTFLFLSGFLAYWSLARRYQSEGNTMFKNVLIDIPLSYFHRYLRLTPIYAALILIILGLWAHLSDGPFYFQGVDEWCSDNWWAALLYINNFYDWSRACVGWGWYLCVDMQIFLIVPVIVLAFVRMEIIGWIMSICCMTGHIIAAVTLTYIEKLPSSTVPPLNYDADDPNQWKNYDRFFDIFYIKPYTRMGPYIIGIIACHVLVQHRRFLSAVIFKPKWPEVLLWFWTLSVIPVLIYAPFPAYRGDYVIPTEVDALYNALARSAWALALSWIIIASACNRAGIVGKILSWNVWSLPARLSYAAYLVHPAVLTFYAQTIRRPIHPTPDISLIWLFFGTIISTFMVSTVLSLAFESPIIALQH